MFDTAVLWSMHALRASPSIQHHRVQSHDTHWVGERAQVMTAVLEHFTRGEAPLTLFAGSKVAFLAQAHGKRLQCTCSKPGRAPHTSVKLLCGCSWTMLSVGGALTLRIFIAVLSSRLCTRSCMCLQN